MTIADINPKLKPIAGTPFDAVQKEGITYYVTGKPKYDEFFKGSAVTYGGLAVANVMVKDTNTALELLEKQPSSKCDAYKLLRISVPALPTAGMTAKGAVDNANKLLPKAAELSKSAKDDFEGLAASEVIDGLQNSRDQLTKSLDEGPALVGKLDELVDKTRNILPDTAACP